MESNIEKLERKNFHSLQSYVRAIWVNTRKRQKWFWGEIISYWIPDAFTKLAIRNTWNKNTKSVVASRNKVEHQSVRTPVIIGWTVVQALC